MITQRVSQPETAHTSLRLADLWHRLPEPDREAFLARRAALPWPYGTREGRLRRAWDPMRPLVFERAAYEGYGRVAARLLHLAVDACRRRAATADELRKVMGDTRELPLLAPDQPLIHDRLLRIARPDTLLCRGVPRFVELNTVSTVYAIPTLDRMAHAYARLWPTDALTTPPPVLEARAALLATVASRHFGHRPRLLVPTWRCRGGLTARLGTRKALRVYLRPTVEAAQQAGLDVIVDDLSRLHTDAHDRLYAAGQRIDLVLNLFAGARVIDAADGLAALARAQAAGTAQLFHPEAMQLLNAKQVLAWLHEDLDLLSPGDRALVDTHVPWTAWCSPHHCETDRKRFLCDALRLRPDLVMKPCAGSGGRGVAFGADYSDDAWRALVTERTAGTGVVLQQRVHADTTTLPFCNPATGQQSTATRPFVLAPFLIGGQTCGALVRHFGPDEHADTGVINTHTGALTNTVLLSDFRPSPNSSRCAD
jgi:hypothetical protein